MQLRLKNEADCLDLQHTELRGRALWTPYARPEPPTARAVSFFDPELPLNCLHLRDRFQSATDARRAK